MLQMICFSGHNGHISPGIVNPSYTEYFFRKHKYACLQFIFFIQTEMVQVIEILPMEDKDSFILHGQYHVCHVSHGIDLVLLEYSGPVFYLLSWSPSHFKFFLQVTWPFSIFTPSDLEAKSLGEIPSDFSS